MTTTINYNKTCPDCKGEPISFRRCESTAKPIMSRCRKCKGIGLIIPKKVIHRIDKIEPEITY